MLVDQRGVRLLIARQHPVDTLKLLFFCHDCTLDATSLPEVTEYRRLCYLSPVRLLLTRNNSFAKLAVCKNELDEETFISGMFRVAVFGWFACSGGNQRGLLNEWRYQI